ncbi:MAG: hypothetical protein NZ898_06335 [Myxococcota bacterium]|nr:hypothetical protein [Myxococcota bacterium]
MRTLYKYNFWPDSMAALVALRHTEIDRDPDVRVVEVDMSRGDHRRPPFSQLGTDGEPPAWHEDPQSHPPNGFVVWNLLGVGVRLDDLARVAQKPRLFTDGAAIPTNPCNLPLGAQWLAWSVALLGPVRRLCRQFAIRPPAQPQAVQAAVAQLHEALQFFEQRGAPGPNEWVNRDVLDGQPGFLSIADYTIGAALTYTRLLPQNAGFQANSFPRTMAYLARVEAQAPFAATFTGVTLGPNVVPWPPI